MVREAEANAAEDARRRQEIELRNQTDALVYSTERALAEHGAKLAEADARAVEQALGEAREALKGDDIERIRRAQEGLTRASQTLAEAMYRQSRAAPAARAAPAVAGAAGRRRRGRRVQGRGRPKSERDLLGERGSLELAMSGGVHAAADVWMTRSGGSMGCAMDASETDAADRAVRRRGRAPASCPRRGAAAQSPPARRLRQLPSPAAREQEAARRDGRRAALLPLLPVLDTLERALAAGSTDPDFYEGVAATHRLFLTALREAGAEPVESVGQPFDPKVHEAVATVPPSGVEPGTVVREIRRGWRLGDELLRPAQVVVAASPEAIRPVAVKFRDYYEVLGVPRTATRRRDQARLPPARAQAPSRSPARRRARQGRRAVQGDQRGLRGPERSRQARQVRRARRELEGRDGLHAAARRRAEWRTVEPRSGRTRSGFSDFFASLFGRGTGRAGGGEACGSRCRAATSRPSCR